MNALKIFLFTLILPVEIFAQLTGKVTDTKGEPLPFANVYVEKTTQGTSANTEGVYSLDLKNGTYRIVFQYIGYKQKIETVSIQNKTELNISLESSDIELTEFTVKANAEDPAYPIIRKAIEMRKVYRDQVKSYTCDVYIKGLQKMTEAPKKILGKDVGDMGGALDTTTRSGILYLSETISKYHVDGSKKKEILTSAKVSGNDNGFGFNRASTTDFSFYDSNIEIVRQILSPIADNALTYYKYKLIGIIKDKQGNDVYKIEVIQKRKEDPTWGGYIYIVDNQWNIHSTDLYVTGVSNQMPVLDTLWLRQSFVPLDKVWRLFSQSLEFKAGIFGFKFKGFFSGIFSNYNLNPQFENNFFNNEIFKASKQKDDNSLTKWDSIRPIPLTLEEQKDYVKKDSIQKVHQTKEYQDSISKKSNKFGVLNLLTGYTYSDRWNRRSFSFDSPINTFNFNPIQGGNLALDFAYRQAFGERFQPSEKSFSLTPSVSYGFAEKKLRAATGFSYQFNRFNFASFNVEVGQKAIQFNGQNPVSSMITQYFSLYEKKHFNKMYDKIYGRIGFGRELVNGLYGNIGFEMSKRTPLNINSQFSFRKKDQTYNSNLPDKYEVEKIFWFSHTAYLANIGFRWVPEQQYSTYPTYKDVEGSKYPTFSVNYTKAIPLSKNSVDYDKLRFRVAKDNIKMGISGYSEINATYSTFLSKTNVQFVDYHHFNGNETILAVDKNYKEGYFQLPFYKYSTSGDYLSAHWQHHFEGFFFDKIPLVRKLAFKEIFRVAYLHTPELKHYAEFGLGIDNIGWGLARFLRVDVSWQYQNEKLNGKPMWMIGLRL